MRLGVGEDPQRAALGGVIPYGSSRSMVRRRIRFIARVSASASSAAPSAPPSEAWAAVWSMDGLVMRALLAGGLGPG